MSDVTSPADLLKAKQQELTDLMITHRANSSVTELPQRVSAFTVAKKGKKLVEYLGNGSPVEEKIALLDELNAIIREERWSDLPAPAAGQAKAAPAPVNTPLIAKEKAAIIPPIAKPAPVAAPAPTPVAMPVQHVTMNTPTPAPVAKPSPNAALAEQIAKLLDARQPEPVNTLNEQQVREIVREELAQFFAKMAECCKK